MGKINQMIVEMQELGKEVIEKGKRTHDDVRVTKKNREKFTMLLEAQALSDERSGISLFNALGWWLGDAKFWGLDDLKKLKRMGEKYLEE